ncbi:MAG TPA: histidine kinase [Ktedonobacteraceae bacterium]|nr:histidine kinase [Ktedonobacteraceae bacterium]
MMTTVDSSAMLATSALHMAREAERRRLARELHDGVVQSLTALVADLEYFRTRSLPASSEVSAEVAEKLLVWQELARESLLSMRQTLGGLRGGSELEAGLEAAIAALLARFEQSGYAVVYESNDWPRFLPDEYTINIYYMVREALTNIRKHAQASRITLFLFKLEEQLHIGIGDNGIGMPISSSSSPSPAGYRQGLIGLRERAALLDGLVTIESRPGEGTQIDIVIPLP